MVSSTTTTLQRQSFALQDLGSDLLTSRNPSLGDASPARTLAGDHIPASASPTLAEEAEGGLVAWTVVAGATTMFFVTLGLVYSFGVLQDALVARGLAPASTLGWVSSVAVVPVSALSIPCNALVRRVGNQAVGLLGALLVGAGYTATSFALHSVPGLFAAQAVFGAGYACVFWASNSIAAQYFVRRRALAVGIVYAGSGVGGAIISITLARLRDALGLEWAVRLFGFFAFATLVPASFALKPRYAPAASVFPRAYFKDPKFLLLMAATSVSTFSLFVPPFFLPSYARSLGLSQSTGAWLTAGYNLASAFGRLLFGWLADSRVGPVTTLFIVLSMMGSSILAIWTVSTSLGLLLLFMVVNGGCSGALLSLQPPVNAAVFGMQDMVLTMSILTLSRAFGSALGAPIAGYLLDAFGGPSSGAPAYRPTFYIMGSLSLISASLVGALRWRMGGWRLSIRV